MFKKYRGEKKMEETKETTGTPKKKKLSPLMQLLAEKLEYYPDTNRKGVILDLMAEVEKRKI
jgi:hypothetical protein